MDKIKCYICKGVFGIDEKYRIRKIQTLKRRKNHIADSWVKKKVKMGIVCPYCHGHLLARTRKIAG